MDDITLNEKIADASKSIFSYCMAKTPTREDAEDLSQDILYELMKSGKNIRDEGAFYGFMWAVAGNVYKQWYRKKLQKKECELTDEITAAEEDEYFAGDESEEIYLLRRELGLLAQKYRHAVILYYIDNKSCAEIARQLSVSESMVKYLLFKSRKILKEGMCMERKLGEHSYNPVSLIPLYCGEGPNRFWEFMKNKIRQNITAVCYNDALTAEQISLETGIPLAYLEDDIEALAEKKILMKEGNHYKANVIIITADCADEIARSSVKYHGIIADKIGSFIDTHADEFRRIGFTHSDFSENTIRWQLAVWIFIRILDSEEEPEEMPVTGWGEKAYLWLAENHTSAGSMFNYCGLESKNGDNICFADYLPDPKSDHHYFYGNDRYINILCDIADGRTAGFSEYDMEAAADMIRMGYVVHDENGFATTMPVYTAAQRDAVLGLISDFTERELKEIIDEMNVSAEKILSDHTPKHLQAQVPGIAGMSLHKNSIEAPAKLMIERGILNTDWRADEMPTMFIQLRG